MIRLLGTGTSQPSRFHLIYVLFKNKTFWKDLMKKQLNKSQLNVNFNMNVEKIVVYHWK
jgi:hypothetical protein